jgi:hypothetical protein
MRYLVICRDDVKLDGSKGDYVIATHRWFASREAAITYTATVSQSREPLVVEALRDIREG